MYQQLSLTFSIVYFSLGFRNFSLVPRCCFTSLQLQSLIWVVISHDAKPTSCAKSFIFSWKLNFAPSGCFGPLIFRSCCCCNILDRGSLNKHITDRHLLHPPLVSPVNLLCPNHRWRMRRGHMTQFHLTHGLSWQESLSRIDEGLWTIKWNFNQLELHPKS